MANNVTELPVKNFDQLDPIDNVQNSDELLIRTGDSYTKRATKINFMKEEVDARTAQDVVLQTHIDDLTSDLAGTTGLAKRNVPNGLASLDSNGLVPASQLPSYVDDVIEGYYNPADGKFYENYTPTVTHDIWTDGTVFLNADTTTGTRPAGMEKSVTLLGAARKHSNTFYNRVGDNWYEITTFTSSGFTTSSTAVSTASIIKALNNATDINISYAQYEEGSYSGEITPETGKVYTDLRTKLTYRWGGSAYVIIASDLALGTTHQTAGFGDESRAAYNHSLVRGTGDVTAHNPHGLSKADIGLSDVPNVTTNNQTPTYTESQTNEELTSGENLATAFGKLKKIVKSFIDHINTTLSTNPHNTTKSDVGLGNVTNVATTDQITSGSTNNVTSGAVYTALTGKLGTSETAADSNYAHAIGTPSSHPAIGSSKLPVYVNASGEVTPISTLQVPTIEGNVEFTGDVTAQGDVEIDGGVEVKDDAIFRKDVAIVGNLSVSGVTTIAEQESAIASDYLITRLNNTQGLGQQGHSGIAVNNYQTNKMATMTVDGNGIWRLSASATKTSQTYTNISLFNDVYYDGLTHTTTTGPTHIITNAQSITASDTVWYADDSLYYHYNGSDWLPITAVTNGQFVYGSAVTDSGKIAALEALTKRTLLYYITVTDNAINESQNQPLLTRDEHGNISNGHLLKWDSTNMRAVDGGSVVDTVAANNMNSVTSNAVANHVNFRYHGDDSQDADANTLTAPGVYSVNVQNPANQHLDMLDIASWCVIYVTRVDNNPYFVQQQLIDGYNREWSRYCDNGTWTSWNRKVIHKDFTIFVESGVTLPTMFSALAYQLSHTNFSFLLAHPWQSAMGTYELHGYYWGQYTATHARNDNNDNNITVTGVIDSGATPHHFSAFYSAATGWTFEIDGQSYVAESNGITLTKDSATGRKYGITQYTTTTIQALYDVLNHYGLTGRPMKGVFNWKMGASHSYKRVSNATVDVSTGALNAGQVVWFTDPRLDTPNGTDSTWWIHWNDGSVAYVANLWGEVGSEECAYCTLEILT